MILDMRNGVTPNGTHPLVLDEVFTLTPVDLGATALISYAVASRPDSSEATISSSGELKPDLAGVYVVTATAGAETRRFIIYVFAKNVLTHRAVTHVRETSQVRSNTDQRRLLRNIARAITPAQLVTLNSTGALPSGLNLHSLGA